MDERRQHIDNQLTRATTGIFLWGFLGGIIIEYTGVWPFLIGALVGYCAAKKELPVISNVYRTGTESVTIGYQKLTNFLAER